MKVYNRNHIYRYTPDFLNNRRLAPPEQIVVNLQAITAAEEDSDYRDAQNTARTYAPDKAQEINEKRLNKLFAEKFKSVENLDIEGLEGKELTFELFYEEAPQDIVREVLRVIRSAELLTAGEQKNFVPESDGASSAPALTAAP